MEPESEHSDSESVLESLLGSEGEDAPDFGLDTPSVGVDGFSALKVPFLSKSKKEKKKGLRHRITSVVANLDQLFPEPIEDLSENKIHRIVPVHEVVAAMKDSLVTSKEAINDMKLKSKNAHDKLCSVLDLMQELLHLLIFGVTIFIVIACLIFLVFGIKTVFL